MMMLKILKHSFCFVFFFVRQEVGLYAIQLAREMGLQVMTTCRGREQELWLRKIIGNWIGRLRNNLRRHLCPNTSLPPFFFTTTSISLPLCLGHIINLPATNPTPAHRRHSLVHHQHLDHLHDVVMQKTHGLGVSCILETMSPYWRRLPALTPVTVTPGLPAPVEDATEGRSGPDPRADSGTSSGANGKDRKEENMGVAPDERRGEEFRPSRLIDLLAFGGRWCSVDDAVQIDPPDTRMLFLRNASVGFVFEHAWGLAGAQVGRYLGKCLLSDEWSGV